MSIIPMSLVLDIIGLQKSYLVSFLDKICGIANSAKGLGWSYPCDAYSLGCIFIEFYTGEALYQTHDNLEHLAMMEAVIGKMPERLVKQAM